MYDQTHPPSSISKFEYRKLSMESLYLRKDLASKLTENFIICDVS